MKNGSAYEYQYAIADHQGNTRVLFSANTPAAQPTSANMEAATNTSFSNYTNRVNFDLMDHTDAGTAYTYAQKLTGASGSQVGLSKSYAVFAGDKVKIEAYAKYFNPQVTASGLSGFAAALTGVFGVTATSTGEALKAFTALNNVGGIVAGGGGNNDQSGFPKLFVNILLFDKNYNLVDAAWQQIDGGEQPVGNGTKLPHDYMSAEMTAKEAGFAYVYFSNENASLIEFYIDDATMTYTPSNVIQSNEYYPYGLQTANSWTRDNTTNNFLANGGTELNATSSLYDLDYRNYDPILGRMNGVDPMADKYSSHSPYNFAFNDPVYFTDRSGAEPDYWREEDAQRRAIMRLGTAFASNDMSSIYRGGNMMSFFNTAGGWSVGSGSLSYGSFAAGDAYFGEQNSQADAAWALGHLYGNNNVSVSGGKATVYTYSGQSYYSNYGNMAGATSVNAFEFNFSAASDFANQQTQGGPGDGNWSYTMAALAMSGVLVADDATGVGVVDDVAIPFLLLGAAATDLYKRQPNGTQYTLRANKNGTYPVYSWGSSTPTDYKYLNAGDIWKIGETIQYDPSSGQQWRYSQSYLNSMNVSFVSEYLGPKTEIVFVQQMKLAQYLYSNGVLPAGNKGLK